MTSVQQVPTRYSRLSAKTQVGDIIWHKGGLKRVVAIHLPEDNRETRRRGSQWMKVDVVPVDLVTLRVESP